MTKKKYVLSTMLLAFSLAASSLCAQGIGIGIGPFRLELHGGVDGEAITSQRRLQLLDNPICYAIREQKELEMIVETEEAINKNEFKSTIKKITLDPYVFGIDKNGQPILRGNIVKELLVKEVKVKYGDEKKDSVKKEEKKSFFSALFTSQKDKDIASVNIRKVSDVRVLEDAPFKAPKNINELTKDDSFDVICAIVPAQ